jgi:DNA-directed RNA polymerase subunit H
MALDVTHYSLVPKHTKISDAEKEKVLSEFHISTKEMPKILKDDPALAKLNVKEGDVIKIERESKTAGVSYYYRVVING